MTMKPQELIDCFDEVAVAVRNSLVPVDSATRRARTDVPGQYALDLIADAAAIDILGKLPVRIVSEESGVHERDSEITVVLDPIDGSTNCSRGLSYWAISICALDADGPLAALVVNQATGERNAAIRGEGAYRDGVQMWASKTTKVEQSVIALSGYIIEPLPWKQFRALGCAALMLCDVAAGGLDGLTDSEPNLAPWDYLGGYLACLEAGAVVCDANGEDLVTDDPQARRQVMAAGTPELLSALTAKPARS